MDIENVSSGSNQYKNGTITVNEPINCKTPCCAILIMFFVVGIIILILGLTGRLHSDTTKNCSYNIILRMIICHESTNNTTNDTAKNI